MKEDLGEKKRLEVAIRREREALADIENIQNKHHVLIERYETLRTKLHQSIELNKQALSAIEAKEETEEEEK